MQQNNFIFRKDKCMKEIIETIILNLVDNKDAVEIKEVKGEK